MNNKFVIVLLWILHRTEAKTLHHTQQRANWLDLSNNMYKLQAHISKNNALTLWYQEGQLDPQSDCRGTSKININF